MRQMQTQDAAQLEAALTAQLHQLQCQLEQRYYWFGKRLLEMAETEQIAVNQLVDEIIETRRTLSKLKGEVCCARCQSLNDADSAFCKRCGHSLAACQADCDKEVDP